MAQYRPITKAGPTFSPQSLTVSACYENSWKKNLILGDAFLLFGREEDWGCKKGQSSYSTQF